MVDVAAVVEMPPEGVEVLPRRLAKRLLAALVAEECRQTCRSTFVLTSPSQIGCLDRRFEVSGVKIGQKLPQNCLEILG